jgi:hypothetical protein
MKSFVALEFVEGLTAPRCKRPDCYEILHRALDLQASVNTVMNFSVRKRWGIS